MVPWGIVVAGGTGSRFGRLKQLETLGDRRVLDRSVDVLSEVCRAVVVVVPSELASTIEVPLADLVVGGGSTRSASVRSGLDALGPDATHVLVHDAARPLASPALVDRVVAALAGGAEGAVPVVPVTDSLRSVDGVPVDRSGFVAVQTPQGFDVAVLRRAHSSVASASDDATVAYEIGADVVHVEGEPTNMKITEPHDIRIAEVLLSVG